MILSLFPGAGLLDTAFEREGFCVVRGPDLLWGGDVRSFHPPPGCFEGVIGGPPCQAFSWLRHFMSTEVPRYNLIPEFERCVAEASPTWFLMENVVRAPAPVVPGYTAHRFILQNRHLGQEQSRARAWAFGVQGTEGKDLRRWIEWAPLYSIDRAQTVTSAHAGEPIGDRGTGRISRYTVAEALRLQGYPQDFFGQRSPFKEEAKLRMIAEGVPLPMGLAVARAVHAAVESTTKVVNRVGSAGRLTP